MKKHLITAALLLAAIGLKAQQGEIVYVDFVPDLSITELSETLWIDFDGDGNGDVCLYNEINSVGPWPNIETSNGWEMTAVQEEDSLSIIEQWTTRYGWFNAQEQEKFAVRKQIDGEYYYVWFRAYWYPTWNPYFSHINFDKYAFCTIPDYPLRYGQTSIIDGVVENDESNSFATIHPNPTNNLVTITGENLRQAEVINTIGQQVLSVQSEGTELSIDMAALPAGIYFVAVTDEEGRKCVRKVVRE